VSDLGICLGYELWDNAAPVRGGAKGMLILSAHGNLVQVNVANGTPNFIEQSLHQAARLLNGSGSG
jgi:hypothetical protein